LNYTYVQEEKKLSTLSHSFFYTKIDLTHIINLNVTT
jgi:hypothetical protein